MVSDVNDLLDYKNDDKYSDYLYPSFVSYFIFEIFFLEKNLNKGIFVYSFF